MTSYPMPPKPESLKDEQGSQVYVNQGASCDVDGRPRHRGEDIIEASILTLSYSLFDTATKVTINNRTNVDAKDDNGCTLNADGSFIIRLNALDNPILSQTITPGQIEDHTIRIIFTWTDSGGEIRTGIIEKIIKVVKLATPI